MKYILAFLLFYISFGNSMGQNETDLSLKFNHIAISVKDVDVAATFYQNVMGLQEITNRTEKEGIRWFSLGEGKELHLISTIESSIQLNRAVHMAVSTANFEGLIKRLEQLKVPYSDWPGTPNKIFIRADGIQQIYIQDPDGYWIEINSAE
ncbi:VOC family protein [Altibacter sp. HG106]|uniref:VOC family protein n=1 Tax=Altibacter sp. HG106 TaxID=3023937 RepID=UPI0023503C26|nr:VOC family protein [Altibacter sp. HG106]MDC7995674.1 VOC family protein [Altibacter sp. HG106]